MPDMSEKITTGKIIRDLREKAKLTRRDFADRVCVSISTVEKWERGVQRPSSQANARVCAYFGVSSLLPSFAVTKNIVNRIALVIDTSSSMRHLKLKLHEMLIKQILSIRKEAIRTKQKSDVLVYFFADQPRLGPEFYDIGSMDEFHVRRNIPSVNVYGSTALYDGVADANSALLRIPVNSEQDISYLVNVLTDGEENGSRRNTLHNLKNQIDRLQATDHWTFTFQFPSMKNLISFCDRTGVPQENCRVWETTAVGLHETVRMTEDSTSNYFSARSMGVTNSRSFYTNMADISITDVKQAVEQTLDIRNDVQIFTAPREIRIRDLIESKGLPYKKGVAFYQLIKPEIAVQDYKKMILIEIGKSGINLGTFSIRKLLGLPQQGTIKIIPKDHGKYEIFIQSTSYTRKIPAGSKVIYHSGSANKKN